MTTNFEDDPAARRAAYRSTVFDGPVGTAEFLDEPGPVGIVTAWNPGRLLSPRENTERDQALREELVRQGIPHVRITGRSPDGGHREESWAVRCPRATTLELARAFAQEAVYVVEGGRLILVECAAGAEAEELGPWRERWARRGPGP
jgi:hypothetical protein